MAKKSPKRDEVREERIEMEIVVDACDSQERAMGWYYYLESELQFPFTAKCIVDRAISPLRVNDSVEVIGMPSEDECSSEVLVLIKWDKPGGLAVPLDQLKPTTSADAKTKEAVADWHYWRGMGYEY